MIVALDASPVSLLTQRRGVGEADACRSWAESLVTAGVTLLLPAIADYEVRRELLRAGKRGEARCTSRQPGIPIHPHDRRRTHSRRNPLGRRTSSRASDRGPSRTGL